VDRAEAELKKTSTSLHFRLLDRGKGFDLQKKKSGEGLGLSSMRERLNAVKGTFVIKSSPGQGTVLEASVPLSGESRST
jgi:signal transduction histidine kinase